MFVVYGGVYMNITMNYPMLTQIAVGTLFVVLFIKMFMDEGKNSVKRSEEINFILSTIKAMLYVYIAAVTLPISTDEKNQLVWIGYFSSNISFPSFVVGTVALYESLSCYINTFSYIEKSRNSTRDKAEGYPFWKRKYVWRWSLRTWKIIGLFFYIIMFLGVSGINWKSNAVANNIQLICFFILAIPLIIIGLFMVKYKVNKFKK